MTWINDNKEWLFSGVGITIITLAFNVFKKQNKINKLQSQNNQVQKSGDKSKNIQAGNDVNITNGGNDV